MTYRQLQQLAKTLRNQGLIAKSFRLNQKANILKAEIERVAGQIEAATTTTTEPQNQEITQEQKDFNTNLIQVYLGEKKYQELENGVVVITTSRIEELLGEKGIDAETFEKLFSTTHGVFKSKENGKELIQLVLEQLEDGTYQLVRNTTGSQAA